MTKSDQTKETTSPMAGLLEAMQVAKFPDASSVGADWIENMSTMGSELLRFMTARVEQDVQTQKALLHAKSVPEVQHIHAQFLQKATDDYAAETAKLMEMGKAKET